MSKSRKKKLYLQAREWAEDSVSSIRRN